MTTNITKQNRKIVGAALILVGLMSSEVSAQIDVEDKAAEQTPFELLWGFDTGG